MGLVETIRHRLDLSRQLREATGKKARGLPGWDPVIARLERQLAFCPPQPEPGPREGRPRQGSLFGWSGSGNQDARGEGLDYSYKVGKVDIEQIMSGTLVVYSAFGPTIGGTDVATIFTVPTNQNFLLVHAYMATANNNPPPLGSGIDFVPPNSGTDKQVFGDSPSNPHMEGIYILQQIPENQAQSGNQVVIYRGAPIVIPGGSIIRVIRSNVNVVRTMFGKIAGYLFPISGYIEDNPPKPSGRKPPTGGLFYEGPPPTGRIG